MSAGIKGRRKFEYNTKNKSCFLDNTLSYFWSIA